MIRRTFIVLTGQPDNLGDTVLRRRALEAFEPFGQTHLYVGRTGASFEHGLKIPPGTHVYRSFARWWLAAARAAFVPRRTTFVLNAGEIHASPADGIWHLALLPLLSLGRLIGNAGVQVGIGVRHLDGVWALPVRWAARLCRLNIWRDQWTRDQFGFGSVAPDWAFALGSPGSTHEDTGREYCALVYRSDRPQLSAEVREVIRDFCRAQSLRPIVMTQVGRDAASSRWLADEIGAELLPWSGDHSQHEERFRAVLRKSALVIGNRVHGLVIGATEGAVPIGLMAHPDVKVGRTLAAVGLGDLALGADDGALDASRVHEFLVASAALRQRVDSAVVSARDNLAAVEQRILVTISGQE